MCSMSVANGNVLVLNSITAPSSTTTITVGSTSAKPTNLAFNKFSYATFTQGVLQTPFKANDGLKNNCDILEESTETASRSGVYNSGVQKERTWWQVDLEKSYYIEEVIITHYRSEFAKNMRVYVGDYRQHRLNPSCSGLWSNTAKVPCNLKGRFVTIEREGQLELCEVEVMGY
mmetsp:Transcript_6778/g.5053  ORF Transcript_6778/g.5053 Transcript_6778/m.5053 type:complete len:174 (+) Transcript_6778:87-608(+)